MQSNHLVKFSMKNLEVAHEAIDTYLYIAHNIGMFDAELLEFYIINGKIMIKNEDHLIETNPPSKFCILRSDK